MQIATDAIDRLHTTAESHNRVMIVEVMVATPAGSPCTWKAGGADVILIPERLFDVEEVCRLIRRRHLRGRYSIVVVAEGAVPQEGTMETVEGEKDEFGHARLGGIGQRLEHEIESRTGFESRATVLGYIQRGGTPTAFDRVLATRLGLAAVDAADGGAWGTMPALKGTCIELVPLSDAVADLRTVPVEDYAAAETFFGWSAAPTSAAPAPCATAAGRWRGSRAGARSERAHRRPRAEAPAAASGTRSRR